MKTCDERRWLWWAAIISILLTPVHARAAETPTRVLLIVMDGARYDVCNQHTMPNLFRFMQDGTAFKHAYSPSSWTLPSHASLFTGLYPPQHGATRLPYQPTSNVEEDTQRRKVAGIPVDDVSIPEGFPTLAADLAQAGYQTIGVFGNPCYGYPIFNLDEGFRRWINVVESRLEPTGTSIRGFYSFDYEVDGKFYTVIPNAAEVADQVMAALEKADPDRPVFLFINFEDPIATPLYHPPSERPAILRDYRRHLEASMRRIDEQLPRILGYFQEGLVIVTSDHGQGVGGKFPATFHGSSLDPEQTHIPMLIRGMDLSGLPPWVPIDLTRIRPLVLRAVGVSSDNEAFGVPGAPGLPHPPGLPASPPFAYAHLDSSPRHAPDTFAQFAVYARDGWLLLKRTRTGFDSEFVHWDTRPRNTAELLRLERSLNQALTALVDLKRIPPRTGRTATLEEANLEYLKSLGYVQ